MYVLFSTCNDFMIEPITALYVYNIYIPLVYYGFFVFLFGENKRN